MHRLNVRRAAMACVCALALVAAGCAAPGAGADAEVTAETAYPDWVRIVPEATEEASYYVGIVSLARGVESGIEAAEADAFGQVAEGQRRHVIRLFDSAAADAGIETTSEERLELRTNIASELTDQLEPATRREDAYYRHCKGEQAEQQETVCEVFVLVRLDHAERDRILSESLAAIGQRKQRDGEMNAAALIEWILRNQ